MTNPTSYTDEQVKHLVNLCSTGPTQAALRHLDVAEALEFLLTDRQRLQAELTKATATALDILELITSEDGEIVDDVNPCRIYDRLKRYWMQERATPNETKEAKS